MRGKIFVDVDLEKRSIWGYLNPPKNTPSIASAWMEMNLASWALRPRLTARKKFTDIM
jgi:hypothetical protein